jgi:integrase
VSVHTIKRKSGTVYKAVWRDDAGKQRSRTFSLKRDAADFEAKVKLAKRQGELAALDAGRQTLEEFSADWWRLYADVHLATATRLSYAALRDRHVIPRLGHVQLRALTPERIQNFQAELIADGVSRETARRTLAMLQGMLERATEWDRIPRNPARYVKKPRQLRTRPAEALAPTAVERLRRYFKHRKQLRDATLISLLAYAGLRPGEALALRWGDIRERTIVINKAVSLGEEKTTKTGRDRTVRLLAPLAADLNEWNLASGRPSADSLVFPTRDGQPWGDFDWRNWRRRRYQKAAKDLGLTTTRPYDLRHSLASLLFAERLNPAEIAEQMGHSIQMLLSTYTHVIEELRGRDQVVAEDEIRTARVTIATEDVAQTLPAPSDPSVLALPSKPKTVPEQGFVEEPTPGLEPGTPSLRVKCSTS